MSLDRPGTRAISLVRKKHAREQAGLPILDIQQAVCPVQPGAHCVHMGISTTLSGVNGVWKEAWEFTGKERKQLASY